MISNRRERIGDLLVTHQQIAPKDLENALAIQHETYEPLGEILVRQGAITEERLIRFCAMQLGVSAWLLHRNPPVPEAKELLPSAVCRAYQFLPVMEQDGRLVLAMRNPHDLDAIDVAQNITGLRVHPVLANESRIHDLIEANYPPDAPAVAHEEQKPAEQKPTTGPKPLKFSAAVEELVELSVKSGATELLLEPIRDGIEVRCRIDGYLQFLQKLPANLKQHVTERFKGLAKLDTIEHRRPQSGSLSFAVGKQSVDASIATMPTTHGERILIQFKEANPTNHTLEELGFSAHHQGLFKELLSRPSGLLLVGGPTGSGKTATLYAALQHLRSEGSNIVTVESPIHAEISGLSQSQVDIGAGLDFSTLLTAAMAQRPDVLMVSDLEEREVADLAVRSALRGHLTLAGISASDAASAIPLLVDIGVSTKMIAAGVTGIAARRLVRRLCEECKEEYSPAHEERQLLHRLGFSSMPKLWKSNGCGACEQRGYAGVAPIVEILPVSSDVQSAIVRGESTELLKSLARSAGFHPMMADALDHVCSGVTSLEEARRVVLLESPTATSALKLLKAA